MFNVHTQNRKFSLQPFIDELISNDMTANGSTTPLTINLKTLLDKVGPGYYAYPGSLTTPTCNQVVSWIVLEDTISISEEQVILYVIQLVLHEPCIYRASSGLSFFLSSLERSELFFIEPRASFQSFLYTLYILLVMGNNM